MNLGLRKPERSIPVVIPASARVRGFRDRLLVWFASNGREFEWRRATASLYVRVVTEVLLQQTTAKAVSSLLPAFLRAFPGWHALASADMGELQQVLKPLGLWRRRSEALKNLARSVAGLNETWPSTRRELEQLPAVGQYVASAVLIFAHGQPEPLLDVNMARVLERYFGPRVLADIRDDPFLQALARRIVRHEQPEIVNWAILDLGALVCTALSPRCGHCPLRRTCRHAKGA